MCLNRLSIRYPPQDIRRMIFRLLEVRVQLPAPLLVGLDIVWDDEYVRTVDATSYLFTECGSCIALVYRWHCRPRSTFVERFYCSELKAFALADMSSLLDREARDQEWVTLCADDDGDVHQVFVRRVLDDEAVAADLPQLLLPHAPNLVSPGKAFELLLLASAFAGFRTKEDAKWPVHLFAKTHPYRPSEHIYGPGLDIDDFILVQDERSVASDSDMSDHSD